MNKFLFKIAFMSIAAFAVLTSCDSDPTLQSYIVDSSEKDGFINTSIPKSILGIDETALSEDGQKAYQSIKKVNLLMLPKTDNNTATFEKESTQLNQILQDEDYKLLMTHNEDGMKAKFLYLGDKDSIDEIIVFGTSENMGMGVARILGDDMNLSGIMKMMKELKDMDIDPAGMKGLLGGMGIDTKGYGEIDQDSVKSILESRGIDTSELDNDMD